MSDATTGGVNIVGAGLAGSLLAILLAKRGLRVTVYERRAQHALHVPGRAGDRAPVVQVDGHRLNRKPPRSESLCASA